MYALVIPVLFMLELAVIVERWAHEALATRHARASSPARKRPPLARRPEQRKFR